jgi:hypothetical protein
VSTSQCWFANNFHLCSGLYPLIHSELRSGTTKEDRGKKNASPLSGEEASKEPSDVERQVEMSCR